jgi:pilus assembly protein CpaE
MRHLSSRVLLVSVNGPAGSVIQPLLETRDTTVTLINDATDAVRELASSQLVIVDAADQEAVARLCRSLRGAGAVAGPPLLAVAHSSDVERRVELLEAGADDVLVYPFDPRELEALIDALLLRAAPVYEPAEAPPPGTQALVPTLTQGQVIVFAAAKGGAGSTTLAVNTALALAEEAGSSVAIADLDFHHGQVATYLDVEAPTTTADMARDDQLRDDPQHIWQSSASHSSGLIVFAAPNRPDSGATIDHQQVVALVSLLRRVFSTLVVDAGSVLEWRSLGLMDHADRVVITVTPDIPALRVLHGALEVMAEGDLPTDRMLYVLNNVYPHQMVTADQIQDHLELKISHEIPYDAQLFQVAANEGNPVILAAPRSAPAQAVRELARLIRGIGPDDATEQPARRRLLGGLLRRG